MAFEALGGLEHSGIIEPEARKTAKPLDDFRGLKEMN